MTKWTKWQKISASFAVVIVLLGAGAVISIIASNNGVSAPPPPAEKQELTFGVYQNSYYYLNFGAQGSYLVSYNHVSVVYDSLLTSLPVADCTWTLPMNDANGYNLTKIQLTFKDAEQRSKYLIVAP